MNLLPATVRVEDNAVYAEVAQGDGHARLAFADPPSSLKAYEGQGITLGIRPEAITDPDGADRTSSHLETLKAKIDVTEPAGSDTFVTTTMGGKDVIGRMRADVDVKAGQVVDLAVNMEKAVPFDPKSEARIH